MDQSINLDSWSLPIPGAIELENTIQAVNATVTVTFTTSVTTQDPTTFMISLLLPLAALGSAVGALLTAYLNFRSRAILMRSVERHSDDLRSIASRWAEQFPWADDPRTIGKSDLGKLMLEPEQIHISVEDEFLFKDLPNHAPKETSLADHWRKYTTHLYEYKKKRFALVSDMGKEISVRTGLPLDPRSQHGLSPYSIRAVYNNFIDELTVRSHYWKKQLEESSIQGEGENARLSAKAEILAVGNRSEMRQAREVLVLILSNTQGTIGEQKCSGWKAHFDEMLSEKQALDTEANQLLREIRDFGAIPIVSGKCKYIKWAMKN